MLTNPSRPLRCALDGDEPPARERLIIEDWMWAKEGLGLKITSPECAVYARIWMMSRQGEGVSCESQAQIARTLGIARETVNRCVGGLVRRGYIEVLGINGPNKTGVRMLSVARAPLEAALRRTRATDDGSLVARSVDLRVTRLATLDRRLAMTGRIPVAPGHGLADGDHKDATRDHTVASCAGAGSARLKKGSGIGILQDQRSKSGLAAIEPGLASRVINIRDENEVDDMNISDSALDPETEAAYRRLLAMSPKRVTPKIEIEVREAFVEALEHGYRAKEIVRAFDRYTSEFFSPERSADQKQVRYVKSVLTFLRRADGLKRWAGPPVPRGEDPTDHQDRTARGHGLRALQTTEGIVWSYQDRWGSLAILGVGKGASESEAIAYGVEHLGWESEANDGGQGADAERA